MTYSSLKVLEILDNRTDRVAEVGSTNIEPSSFDPMTWIDFILQVYSPAISQWSVDWHPIERAWQQTCHVNPSSRPSMSTILSDLQFALASLSLLPVGSVARSRLTWSSPCDSASIHDAIHQKTRTTTFVRHGIESGISPLSIPSKYSDGQGRVSPGQPVLFIQEFVDSHFGFHHLIDRGALLNRLTGTIRLGNKDRTCRSIREGKKKDRKYTSPSLTDCRCQPRIV